MFIKISGAGTFILLLVDFPFEALQRVNPRGQTNPLSLKNEKSEMCCNNFQVIISPAFPYWKPILSDWFPWETCQFSFIFQFATASVRVHSLCWIIKRQFSWPFPTSQLQTYDSAAKSTSWYIDMMQNCDNFAIDSKLSENTKTKMEVLNCYLRHNCGPSWFFPVVTAGA